MDATMRSLRVSVLVSLCVHQLGNVPAQALPRTWIGGNADWNAVAASWNPADEPDDDDEAIFNTPNSVDLANASELIQALTMSGGIDLNLNGNDMIVDGLVGLSGSSTNLTVGGAAASLQADSIDVNADATLVMAGGTLTVIEETDNGTLDIAAGGTLRGNGVITFGDLVIPPTDLLNLTGTLSASSTGLIIIGAPPAGTLTINVSDLESRIDLDESVNAVVNVFRNQTLDVNATLTDAFSASMNLFHNSTVDIRDPWSLNTGTIDVDNGFVAGSTMPFFPAIPADTSFIAGGAFTQTGGTITVVDDDGALQFNAAFTQNGGNLVNNGVVIFNANATIAAGANFTMPTNSSSITVNAGVTVNVDQANFNADGGESATNEIEVHSGGLLDLDLGLGGDGVFDNVVTLNGGELDVTNSSSGDWTVERTFNLNHFAGNPAVMDGDHVVIGNDAGALDANFNVAGDGASQINTTVAFASDADVNIAAGATLELNGNARFAGVNGANNAEFTGDGILELDGGDNTVFEPMTVDMPGGRIDLDGSGGIAAAAQTLTLGASGIFDNADLTLNVTAIDSTDNSFGKSGIIGSDTIVLNLFSDLIVNLTDPNAEWTLTSAGVLDINAVGGMLGGSGIQGSDFNMNGTATISGNSIWGARTDISGTVTVAAASSLNLRGGDLTDANVNRLEGGTINGAGILRSLNNEGLFGFGTIATDIEFDTNTELRADNGILNVTGPILDLGVFGTADTDGILNRPAAWNTATNIDFVNMRGGEIRGGTITNDNTGGITGFGLISAPVINNTVLVGANGTLVVETALNNNDWDGATNTGEIRANSGDVEIRDDTFFLFQGRVTARPGQTVFANGFELEFQPASTLTLASGRYNSTHATDIGGTVAVLGGAESTLANDFSQRFENGSTTTLTGNLRLDSPSTTILAGADFTGAGALINLAGRSLRLLDGVVSSDLGVLIDNRGILQLGSAGQTGQISAVDYQQAPGGEMEVEFAGTGLAQFDRMNLTGAASLAGTLDLALLGMFVPAVGNTFNILSANGGVTGTFSTVNQPAALLAAGLEFNVVYNPTLVQLVVANLSLPGDYNLNGVVDAADYALWRDTLGMSGAGLAADGDGDGMVDNDDYGIWRANFGAGAGSGSGANAGLTDSAAVPEPKSFLMLLLACTMFTAGRQRSPHRYFLQSSATPQPVWQTPAES